MHKAFLQLGSNMGNRKYYINLANKLIISKIGDIHKFSKIYESEPWGVEGQNKFLNQVIEITCDLKVYDLLSKVLEIEDIIGRVRNKKWDERIIDIDILLYNEMVVQNKRICIPHIFMHERKFVLIPLNEIAPDLIHPRFNKTISELLVECGDNKDVDYYGL